jgi:hypothetical protein
VLKLFFHCSNKRDLGKSRQKPGKSKQKTVFSIQKDCRHKIFKSAKSNHKNSDIPTIIRENPNKKAGFLLFGFGQMEGQNKNSENQTKNMRNPKIKSDISK